MGQRLGQHFLKNKKRCAQTVRALAIKEGDGVVEVGPGHGELTLYLLEAGANVLAVEKDEQLAGKLKERFKIATKEGRLKVMTGDILRRLERATKEAETISGSGAGVKVAGNIPYYLTGRLIRMVGELAHRPSRTVFMVQKEVAERACAKKGAMNILAASVQYWADASIVAIVPKKNFSPPPKVESAILSLNTKKQKGEEDEKYYQFIRALFKQPRKMAINNLIVAGYERGRAERALEVCKIKNKCRPQNFGIEDIKCVAEVLMSEV